MLSQAERRVFPRYSVCIPVRFSSDMLDFDGTVEIWEGETADVSRSGLYVRSDYLEVPGTPVQVSLQMPGGKHRLHLTGRVAWVLEVPPKGPGMGIRLRDGPIGEKLFERLLR